MEKKRQNITSLILFNHSLLVMLTQQRGVKR
jgi:hypothetical protein